MTISLALVMAFLCAMFIGISIKIGIPLYALIFLPLMIGYVRIYYRDRNKSV